MSQKFLPAVFAVVLASGAAFGQSVSPADAQLAASAGVEPGVYTTAQMIQIIEARHEGDAAQLAFLLGQSGPAATRTNFTAVMTSVGSEGLSFAEQIQLQEARHENDRATEAFILSGTNHRSALPASAVTPGEAQLAAIVGADPADYTLAELVAMQPATTDD